VFIRGYSLHFFFVSWWLCGYEVIMQNKANLLVTQMNVSSVKTKDYENIRLCRRGEKQTQSNPIYSELVEPTCSELVEPIADQPPHFSKNLRKSQFSPQIRIISAPNFRKVWRFFPAVRLPAVRVC